MFWWLWIVLIIIFYAIVIYNSIIDTKNTLEEAKSSIDVMLQNRYDLIPNLVETVRWYAKHEKEVFENITKLRTQLIDQSWSMDSNRIQKENMLTEAFKSLFAVAENYPQLKSNKNFLALQNQLTEIEDRIQAARRTYNAAVKELKNKKQMFPYNIIASMMKLPGYPMFEAKIKAKENFKINI